MSLTKVTYFMIDGAVVNVLDYGADPTGTADSSSAVQAATDTGNAVYFPQGTYRVSGITRTGKTIWFSEGDAKILSDTPVLTVTSGSGSIIDNIELENITAPWIIYRDPANWSTPPVLSQSNGDGYQPTVNDLDIWSTLTTEQQNQNIGPQIIFQGNATKIQVSRIKGRFVTILIKDATFSVVQDCNFRGGKSFAGGITFWNIDAQSGSFNSAINNKVTYASFSGIIFARNFNGLIEGNQVELVGESGIKTYQNTTGGVDYRCYRMTVADNQTQFCYYDGFDISSDFPHTGTIDSRHLVSNNDTFGNRGVGFYADGRYNVFVNNRARKTQKDGIRVWFSYCTLSNNYVYDCNLDSNASIHQFTVDGAENLISGNRIIRTVAVGSCLYATEANFCANNYSTGGANFFGNTGSITATLANNIDDVSIMTGVVSDGTLWYQNPAPTTAPTSTVQNHGSVTYWLDEAGSNLKFQVRYSNGTVKTGTVAVV
jgi:parallel beta-helix repeat protein